MNISLEKAEITKLYCYIRQGERSVDHCLSADWAGLRRFYDMEKKSDIKRMADNLQLVVAGTACTDRMGGDSISLTIVDKIRFRLFVRFMWGLKHCVSLSNVDLCYMCRTLDDFIAMLGCSDRPQTEAIISIRLRLRACADLLELRLRGWRMLDKAKHVEHFNAPNCMKTFRIEDLCRMI